MDDAKDKEFPPFSTLHRVRCCDIRSAVMLLEEEEEERERGGVGGRM